MFIETQLMLEHDTLDAVLRLRPVEFDDLSSLPTELDVRVTEHLSAASVALLAGLCARDEQTYDQLAQSKNNAYWGVFSDDSLVAITGLHTITSEDSFEVSSGGLTAVFRPEDFGKRIASRVLPARSWYGFAERNLDSIVGYVGIGNERSRHMTRSAGYVLLGVAEKPGTHDLAYRFRQYNPDLGFKFALELACPEALELGYSVDALAVERAVAITKQNVELAADLRSQVA